MSKYYKVDSEKWKNIPKLEFDYPNIQKDKVYECFSLLWIPNTLLRVVDDLGESTYISSEFMIPIDILRDKIIDKLINND